MSCMCHMKLGLVIDDEEAAAAAGKAVEAVLVERGPDSGEKKTTGRQGVTILIQFGLFEASLGQAAGCVTVLTICRSLQVKSG